MFDLSPAMPPTAFRGVICFENQLDCLEVRICPSTPGSQIEVPLHRSRALCADTSSFWSTKKPVTVSFLDVCSTDSFTQEQVEGLVKDGARYWIQDTGLRFKFLNMDDPVRDRADIRISFKGSGSYSVIGTATADVESGQPTMNLDFKHYVNEAQITRTVLHEFGHALGFHHEHSSPNFPLHLDREAIMNLLKDKLQQGTNLDQYFQDNFAKLSRGGAIKASSFDEHSIMMYTIWPGWNKEGKRIERSLTLSETDRKMVRKWYPPRTIRQSMIPVRSRSSKENMRLSMGNIRFTSLTQQEGSGLFDEFRCKKPECRERQCDTCYRYNRYLEGRVEVIMKRV
ncbi:hypothetical protein F4859DRAFT_482062 [Xylaria cf. heliscus]|nr:hypothetical protein F4859DRAFT_482062 [Xylaria cf. heliscus]